MPPRSDNNGRVPPEPRDRLPIASAPNLRDLGGWPVGGGGRVRHGVVFRSAGLSRLQGDDLAVFARLGVRTVFDLRAPHEVEERPDVLPEDVSSVHLDVLADAHHSAPAELPAILADPSRAVDLLGDGQAERYFQSAYRDFVTLPSARDAYHRLFEALAVADRPVLLHCASGKDRTGWASAVLLLLLGVPDEVVLEEYLLSNVGLRSFVQPWIEQFTAAGGDRTLLMPLLSARPSYLEAALDEMRSAFGTLEEYAATGLGLSPATLALLRHRLVAADATDTSGTSGTSRHRGLVRGLAIPSAGDSRSEPLRDASHTEVHPAGRPDHE